MLQGEIRYFYKGAYRQGWIICRQGCGYNIDVNGLGMQEWFVAGQVHSVVDFLSTDCDNEETFERIEA
jgi:hypothetical protein